MFHPPTGLCIRLVRDAYNDLRYVRHHYAVEDDQLEDDMDYAEQALLDVMMRLEFIHAKRDLPG